MHRKKCNALTPYVLNNVDKQLKDGETNTQKY